MEQKKKEKKITIRKKMLKRSAVVITVSLLLVGLISSYINFSSTVTSLKQTMTETVQVAADTITNELDGYKKLANELTFNPVFRMEAAGKERLTAECEAIAKRNGVASIGVSDAGGMSLTTGTSIEDREYFTVPKQSGEAYISDPIVRKDNGEMNLFISAPILENNTFKGVVFIGIDASFLCSLVSEISIGKTGNASLINNNGDTIGYNDVQLVLDAYNTQNEMKKDKKLEQLASVERKVMAGETGFGEYTYGKVAKYAAYSPVKGTNGWGLYVAVAKSEFLSSTNIGVVIVILLSILAIIAAFLVMRRLADTISASIHLSVKRIEQLSEGDIHSAVPDITTGDETQILAESTGILVSNLNKVINDIDYCLDEMSEGNFNVHTMSKNSYVGDFENILACIEKLNSTLSNTLGQITEVSGQVAAGSEEMAQNAQSLAEGATDQAGAVEELNATIAGVADVARESAENAKNAYEKAKQSAQTAENSNGEIEKLSTAMEQISDTSREIETIIGAIEEIASQTNLLSLNASIEAARAGEAGKGFAVVASQIGKLAADSAKSAVSTRELIVKSLEEIQEGNNITLKTKESMLEVIAGMRELEKISGESRDAFVSQAESLKEIEAGVEQISGVVQSNSASAEETSATSEELSAQSDNLNSLIGRFRLQQ